MVLVVGIWVETHDMWEAFVCFDNVVAIYINSRMHLLIKKFLEIEAYLLSGVCLIIKIIINNLIKPI